LTATKPASCLPHNSLALLPSTSPSWLAACPRWNASVAP